MSTLSSQSELAIGAHHSAVTEFLKRMNLQLAKPSLEQLEKIARRFSELPYENVSKIIKRNDLHGAIQFRLPDEVLNDHLQWNLGGTCFSLTYYLLEILTYCGYNCQPIMGDMKWGENVHCAILVHKDAHDYLIDPGYLIYQPLQISKDTITRHLTPHSGIEIRFVPEVERYDLYTFRNGQFTWRYRFTAKAVSMDNFAEHWIGSFSKPTMSGVCLTRTENEEMIYIHNDFVKITRPERVQRAKSFDTTEKLIVQKFGIPLKFIEEARSALDSNQQHIKYPTTKQDAS